MKPGGIDITNSSSRYETNNLPILIDFWSDGVWTSEGELNQFFIIDFKNKIACIERYALRLFSGDHYPISWSVYGSLNGKNWSLIDHRDHDICADFVTTRTDGVYICGKYAVEMFEVSNPMCVSYIKVQQDGKNSGSKYYPSSTSEWHNAFYLNGFETFGRICYFHFQSLKRCQRKYELSLFLIILIK